MNVIELKNAGLTYWVRQRRRMAIKDYLVGGLLKKSFNPFTEIEALKDLNFRFVEGSRVGIIGHNGAGKSTLLRLIVGIYPPTAGEVVVQGQVNSMLDIGVGIEPEATGWENIYFRALLMGYHPKQIREKCQEIADFSELGPALDLPVRCYSSGMSVRLMFSIATCIEPEILVMDEILGAGDLGFHEKANKRMMQLIDRARILFLASHNMETIRQLCSHCLWLDHGRVCMEGRPNDVISAYNTYMTEGKRIAA
jgi:ABC-type polysaccharide/polyol phosphate transport system ATPase subunit